MYRYRIHHGHYSSRSKLHQADSVATEWRAIAETHLLEGRHNPRKPRGCHTKDLKKRLTMMRCHFLYQDPPSKQETAIPLGLVMAIVEAADISCPFAQCQANLIQISLFFCLWLCEYTKINLHRRRVQFRIKDLQFNYAYRFIPHDSSSKTFLCAGAITLSLDIQKNSLRYESTTMEATNLGHGDPISAANICASSIFSHTMPNLTPPSAFTFPPRVRFIKESPELTLFPTPPPCYQYWPSTPWVLPSRDWLPLTIPTSLKLLPRSSAGGVWTPFLSTCMAR